MSLYVVQHQEARAEERLQFWETPSTSVGPCWVDMGFYEAPDGRSAVRAAMEGKGMDEGAFRAIPEASARVHVAKVVKRTVWDTESGPVREDQA